MHHEFNKPGCLFICTGWPAAAPCSHIAFVKGINIKGLECLRGHHSGGYTCQVGLSFFWMSSGVPTGCVLLPLSHIWTTGVRRQQLCKRVSGQLLLCYLQYRHLIERQILSAGTWRQRCTAYFDFFSRQQYSETFFWQSSVLKSNVYIKVTAVMKQAGFWLRAGEL